MAKLEVSFVLILRFVSLFLLVSSPAVAALPSSTVDTNSTAKKDGDGVKILNKNVGLVRHLCNETGHYNLCVAAVEADPRSSQKLNPKGILRIVMDKTLSNATAIKEYIDHILADNSIKIENITRSALEGCSSGYEAGIYDFKHGFTLLGLKNNSQYLELKSWISSIMGVPFVCDQSFIQLPIPSPNPLTGINNCVEDLGDTSVVIVDIIYRNLGRKSKRV